MFKYEKPIVEIIDLMPADKIMGSWDDDTASWGDNMDMDMDLDLDLD